MNDQVANSQKITVNTVLAAERKKVWEYYTQPTHMTQWNVPSRQWECLRVENDPRKGGKLFVRMEARDHSFGFDFEAVYETVQPEQFLSYTLTDGRNVQVWFEDLGLQTKVSVRLDTEPKNCPKMQQQDRQAILERFKRYVETKESTQ
jgi:uncharacterized protein YndB with AHSA1/START domain